MLELTKGQSTGGFVDLTVRAPEAVAARVEAAVRAALAGIEKADVASVADDARLTPEQVFGPRSPGRLLKGLRAREGWTQSDLAERLGTTKTVISDMETGRRPISRKTAMKLEEMTGTDYRVFL